MSVLEKLKPPIELSRFYSAGYVIVDRNDHVIARCVEKEQAEALIEIVNKQWEELCPY